MAASRQAWLSAYIQPFITSKESADGNPSLCVPLSGGNFAIFSPLIRVSADQQYLLKAKVKAVRLKHNYPYVFVSMFDQQQRPVGKPISVGVTVEDQQNWQVVSLGPFVVPNKQVRFIRVGLGSHHDNRRDLQGTLYFDQINLTQLHKLQLSTNRTTWTFSYGKPIDIDLVLYGLPGSLTCKAQWKLLDLSNTTKYEDAAELRWNGDHHKLQFSLSPRHPGYFSLNMDLIVGGQSIVQPKCKLVVLPKMQKTKSYGLEVSSQWHGDYDPFELVDLAQFSKLKLPIWSLDSIDPENQFVTRRMKLLNRCVEQGVECTTILDSAPPMLADKIERKDDLSELFQLPREQWKPSLQSLLLRYGSLSAGWQLGYPKQPQLTDRIQPRQSSNSLICCGNQAGFRLSRFQSRQRNSGFPAAPKSALSDVGLRF